MVNLEGTILIESLRNFVRMFISMKSWPDLKMGDEGSRSNLRKIFCTLYRAQV